ncbi:hypothetical protein BC943DRAFT_377271 [Umbelopsis sp. AD052]|nr:hypothetical protein BC943DRAFT_377271 [Umbelopsis sp. AD052]
MQPGVRDVNQLNRSLRAIEQICAFARISLNLQETNSFEDACGNLLGIANEDPFYQPGYEESMLLCLKLVKENSGPAHIDLALKVFDQIHNSNKLAPEHQLLLANWSEEVRQLKLQDALLEVLPVLTNNWDYMLPAEHTLGPVKLIARKMKTSYPFFIGAHAFSRLHTNLKAEDGDVRPSALLLVLKIWKAKSHSSRTYWPQNLSIILNGATLSTGMRRHLTKSRQSTVNFVIGKDGCMDITPLIVKGKNILLVQRDSKDTEDINLLIETYSVETQEAVVDLVKKNCLPENVWRNLLKNMLANTSPADSPSRTSGLPGSLTPVGQVPEPTDLLFISQTSLRISSQCPITLRTIHTPVRGIDCKHFDPHMMQCFELESYLLVNKGMADWKCPLCNLYTPPKKLVYDLYLQGIFSNIPSRASEIEFRVDTQRTDKITHEFIVDSTPVDPDFPTSTFYRTSSKGLDTATQPPSETFTIVEIDD